MENEEVIEEIKDLPFGITNEEYLELGGDDNDTNKDK